MKWITKIIMINDDNKRIMNDNENENDSNEWWKW